MVNYVNQDAFFQWYESVTGKTKYDHDSLLNDVFMTYCNTHKSEFTVPAARSVTGKAESIKFTFENLGCCGASTMYITF